MTEKTKDIIPVKTAKTLPGLFVERVKRTPAAKAYVSFDETSGEWQETTWEQAASDVAKWQRALVGEGFMAGDRVAIMLKNSYEWMLLDIAAMGLGLVIVPLYANDSAGSAAYIIKHSGAKFLLVENNDGWDAISKELNGVSDLKRIVTLSKVDDSKDERVKHLSEWLSHNGGEMTVAIDDPDKLATIVYTSGTTGSPKGVMLSHRNILVNAHDSLQMAEIGTDDIFLSFLPLSHMFERTAGYYLPMMAGSAIAYARSIPQLGEDLVTIRPTVFISVPRIFEKVYAKIEAGLLEKPPIVQKLFTMAVDVGWHRFEHEQGRAGWSPKLLLWPILNALVAKKVMDKLGGRIQCSVTGGAALPPSVAKVFIGLGLPLIQGYGLTETSPVITVNTHANNDPESVGLTLNSLETRIGENDELQMRGPTVMLGYWNNDEATKAMFTEDGWLKTGDKAAIRGGRVYITGRLKEIIVMSNGEKAPPAEIEMAISLDPLIEKVMLVGEQKPFMSAIVCINSEMWPSEAEALKLAPNDPESLKNDTLHKHVMAKIATVTSEIPEYARIRKIFITLEEWTVENGLITPTLKVKRNRVLEHYSAEIEKIYEKRNR